MNACLPTNRDLKSTINILIKELSLVRRTAWSRLLELSYVGIPVLCGLVDNNLFLLLLYLYLVRTMHIGSTNLYMNLLHTIWNLFLLFFFFAFFATLLTSPLFLVEFIALDFLLVFELNGIFLFKQEQLLHLFNGLAFDILAKKLLINYRLTYSSYIGSLPVTSVLASTFVSTISPIFAWISFNNTSKSTGTTSFFLVIGASTGFYSTMFDPKRVFWSASKFRFASLILFYSTLLFSSYA